MPTQHKSRRATTHGTRTGAPACTHVRPQVCRCFRPRPTPAEIATISVPMAQQKLSQTAVAARAREAGLDLSSSTVSRFLNGEIVPLTKTWEAMRVGVGLPSGEYSTELPGAYVSGREARLPVVTVYDGHLKLDPGRTYTIDAEDWDSPSGRFAAIRATSSGMQPEISPRDWLIVNLDKHALREGEMLIIAEPGVISELLVGRAQRIEGNWMLVEHNGMVTTLRADQVLGRVMTVVHSPTRATVDIQEQKPFMAKLMGDMRAKATSSR